MSQTIADLRHAVLEVLDLRETLAKRVAEIEAEIAPRLRELAAIRELLDEPEAAIERAETSPPDEPPPRSTRTPAERGAHANQAAVAARRHKAADRRAELLAQVQAKVAKGEGSVLVTEITKGDPAAYHRLRQVWKLERHDGLAWVKGRGKISARIVDLDRYDSRGLLLLTSPEVAEVILDAAKPLDAHASIAANRLTDYLERFGKPDNAGRQQLDLGALDVSPSIREELREAARRSRRYVLHGGIAGRGRYIRRAERAERAA